MCSLLLSILLRRVSLMHTQPSLTGPRHPVVRRALSSSFANFLVFFTYTLLFCFRRTLFFFLHLSRIPANGTERERNGTGTERERNGNPWNGTERNGGILKPAERNGTERRGTARNGTERNRSERNGAPFRFRSVPSERNGTERGCSGNPWNGTERNGGGPEIRGTERQERNGTRKP